MGWQNSKSELKALIAAGIIDDSTRPKKDVSLRPKKDVSFDDYMMQCVKDCTNRICEPCFFSENGLQKNALRVEILRDMTPRCGLKMPEHWHESVKQRGWGLWVFSGGSASVFGHCDNDCPRKKEFIRTAPKKQWRLMNEND